MKTLLFLLTVVGVGFVWLLERNTATNLRARLLLAREESTEVASLARERERLQRRQQKNEEHAQRARAAHELSRAATERTAREQGAQRPLPTFLTAGEWLPIAAWQNRSNATPTATVETALWAAAGGDVATLKEMLQLDEPTRAKAADMMVRLPESARTVYASAEHLIAAFTTKSIPLGDAQLVWEHQPGPDEAVACVFVKNAEVALTSPSATPLPHGNPDGIPPMAPGSSKTIATYLSLRRTDHGWRLVVPVSAVEKIVTELGGSR